jgi:hypothetical protein
MGIDRVRQIPRFLRGKGCYERETQESFNETLLFRSHSKPASFGLKDGVFRIVHGEMVVEECDIQFWG